MARNGWLCWSVGLGCCLMTGCLFHRGATRDPIPVEGGTSEVVETIERTAPMGQDPIPVEGVVPLETTPPAPQAPEAAPAPRPAPMVLSNYSVLPQQSGTVLVGGRDGPMIAPARLEVTPASSGPTLGPPPANESPRPTETPALPPATGTEPPLVAALRCALEKHPREASQALEKYGSTNREVLLALLGLAAGIGEGEIEKLPPEEVARTLEHLHGLTRNLRLRAPLALGKVCFCRKISSFGLYDPLPDRHAFQAGCDGRAGECVRVYAEVFNFGSVAREGGFHETALQSTLEIHDDQRRPVVTMKLGTCTDRSQSPRQDYFLNFQFHVPPRLPPGLYTLWITVEDVTPTATGQPAGKRVAKRSLDLQVAPSGKVSAAP